MRFRLVLLGVAALAVAVPGAAFAHGGQKGRSTDKRVDKFVKKELKERKKADRRYDKFERRFDRRFDKQFHGWWGGYHHDRYQTFELGAEPLYLTGVGMMGSRSVKQAKGQVSEFRAWHGKLKVYAKTDDVKVTCTGRGYKHSEKSEHGYTITKCHGIGVATVTGSEYMFVFKAKVGQAWFPGTTPADATASAETPAPDPTIAPVPEPSMIHTSGLWWKTGEPIPVDGEDTPLEDIVSGDRPNGHHPKHDAKSDDAGKGDDGAGEPDTDKGSGDSNDD